MVKTECKNCRAEVSPDDVYTDVCDEERVPNHEGCVDCSMACSECGYIFDMEIGLKDAGDGDHLCKNCWEHRYR